MDFNKIRKRKQKQNQDEKIVIYMNGLLFKIPCDC